MEPLSVVASIIAVIQAGDRLSSLLQKIKPLWSAPRDIEALINELNDLTRVLQHLQAAVDSIQADDDSVSLIPVCESLCKLVDDAGSIILELETMVDRFLRSTQEHGNGIKVHRVLWARKLGNVQALRRKLKDLELTIMLQACSLNLSSNVRMKQVVEEIGLRTSFILAHCKTLQGHVAQQLVFAQLSSSQILPAAPNTEKTIEGSQSSELSMYTDTSAMTDDKSSLDGQLESTLALQPLLRMSGVYPRFCPCVCHIKPFLEAPLSMHTLFGSVSMLFSGAPPRNRRCNITSCRTYLHSNMRLKYAFPKWFLPRVLVLSLSFSLHHGPELLLRVLRSRPPDDPLFSSIRRGDVKATRLLLTSGKASVLDVTTLNRSALWYAIDRLSENNSLEIIQLLLSAGADIHQADDTFQSPVDLMWTKMITDRDPQVNNALRCLVPQAMEVPETKLLSRLHLIVARQDGDIDQELELLSTDVNALDADGRTALHYAVTSGRTETVLKLLHAGANPNIKTLYGYSPFLVAASMLPSCLELLLTYGADVHTTSHSGRTALHVISDYCRENSELFYATLLKAGADINAQGSEGYTALHYAIRNDNVTSFKYLLGRGANPNIGDNHKRSCVLYAIMYNRPAIVRLLLQSGADSSAPDKDHATVWHYLALYSGLEALEALAGISLGAVDTEQKRKDGATAMDLVMQRVESGVEWRLRFVEMMRCSRARGTFQEGYSETTVSTPTSDYEDALDFGEMNKSTESLLRMELRAGSEVQSPDSGRVGDTRDE